MPTIITHGLVGLAAAAKIKSIHVLKRWHLLVACAICTMLPDIDYIGFKMGIQYNSLFGHRGFTHSFLFAALIAGLAGWLLNRLVRGSLANFGKLFLLVFAVTATHTLLDAMTDGGEGVAFFSPFSNHRYFFSYRPIMVSPLGIEAFFHLRGLMVLLNEFVLVIVPVALVLYGREIGVQARAKKTLAVAALIAWILLLTLFTGLYPLNNISMTVENSGRPAIDLYVKQSKNPQVLNYIPTVGLPDGKLILNFNEFQSRGLFSRKLQSKDMEKHWASGFFSSWYGGIGGRWQTSNVVLLLRTFLGYGVPGSRAIQDVLKDPDKRDYLFSLSPTEKYDLAEGDYKFASTKSILGQTHNASELPKYWFGICNGMAAASKWYEEPYRTVDVINPNGFHIIFHPNDIKALVGYALANVSNWSSLGTLCDVNGPEAEGCRINAGSFFLATMNRLGVAQDSFIIDGFSGPRKQFYLFDGATVDLVSKPTPIEDLKAWTVPTPVKYLAKVRYTMDIVSTLLSDKIGNVPDGASGYKKVGRVLIPKTLDAIIAMNENGDVIGGAWTDDQDVPDVIFFPNSGVPALDKQNHLKLDATLSWPVIKQLYEKSVSAEPNPPPIDFSL